MSSCNKVFSSISLALVRCLFLLYFRWIILLIVTIRFNAIFSLSIGSRYTIRINNRFIISYGIVGVVSFLVFLLFLLLLQGADNVFFLHLRIFLDSLLMPLRRERVLGV